MLERRNSHTPPKLVWPRPRRRRRGALAPAAACALLLITAACGEEEAPLADGGEPCDLAAQALVTAQEAGGVTDETMAWTEQFLASLQQTDDATLLYWGSYVGDAYRGLDPGSTLPSMLVDVVEYCGGS